jgi:hypothetical protein
VITDLFFLFSNIIRFPEDFMFQLTREEIPEQSSKSQFATLNEAGNQRCTHIKQIAIFLVDAQQSIRVL